MSVFAVTRSPRHLVFGRGQRLSAAAFVQPLGTRALICTDIRMSAEPMLTELVDALTAAGVQTRVFDRTEPEVPLASIAASVAFAETFVPQIIIGLGGGSCLDMAKVTALILSHGGSARDYYGEFRVPGPILPVVAIPTTAGTGSEVTPVAVVADPDRALKVGIASPYLIPHIAICDPELTFSCPPGLTAIAGADALTHAVEAFTAAPRTPTSELVHQYVFLGKNALSDSYALSAIAHLTSGLGRAVRDGDDADARDQVMYGAMNAGLAFGTAGTAAAHAIQYPVGARTHTAHGAGVACLLPYVMEYNLPGAVSAMAAIGETMGVASVGGTPRDRAVAAIDAVAELLASIGIPATLQQLGLQEAQQSWVAEQALGAARLVKNNPRPLDISAMRTIVGHAFSGDRMGLRQLVKSA